MKRSLLLMTVSIFAMPAAATAQASADPDGRINSEIIVTAQKRAENVQTVPISVTVISGDQLVRRGVTNVQDLSQASASLEFTAPSASPGGGGFVRGIGTQALGAATAQSSVSVVLDGIVLGNTTVTDIFDTERVEVLKGPQGTLFGSSVSAGVISITTKAPKLGETSGFVSGEFAIKPFGSEYARHVLRGAVNLPIGERAALRIASYGYGNSGISHNVAKNSDSNFDSYGVRVRFLAEINDALQFNLIGDYGKNREVDGAGLVYRSAPAGSPLEHALTTCGITASARNVDNCSNLPRFSNSTVGGVSGQFDLDLSGLTLTSITSYRANHDDSVNDVINISTDTTRAVFGTECTFVNCNPVVSLQSGYGTQHQVGRRKLFTQELRLASDSNGHLEWVVGAFYQKAKLTSSLPSLLLVHPVFLPQSAPDLVLNRSLITIKAENEDYAAFGNATFYVSPETRLIGGARYSHSRVQENYSLSTLEALGPTGLQSDFATTKDDALTWRLGIQHDFAKDTMAYLTVSTGYKAPQINDGQFPLTAIKSERPVSFELGVKTALFDSKLFVNADIYYTRVKNFQSQSCVPGATGLNCTNINVDKVNTKGFELEVFGRPIAGNMTNATLALNDAKYPSNFAGADGTFLDGLQLNYSPRYKITLSTEQEFPLDDELNLFVGADATFRGKQSMYLSSNPAFVTPAQSLFNARIGVRSSKGWSISLFGRNLGNKIYPTQLFPTQAFHPGGIWHVLDANSQRTVGLQLQANF